jgi:hypothetical protein
MVTPKKEEKCEFLVLNILQDGWRILLLRGVLFGQKYTTVWDQNVFQLLIFSE